MKTERRQDGEAGMTKLEFIDQRTKIISKMLDSPDKNGIYPTTLCFGELDHLFDKICEIQVIIVHSNTSPMNNWMRFR